MTASMEENQGVMQICAQIAEVSLARQIGRLLMMSSVMSQ